MRVVVKIYQSEVLKMDVTYMNKYIYTHITYIPVLSDVVKMTLPPKIVHSANVQFHS